MMGMQNNRGRARQRLLFRLPSIEDDEAIQVANENVLKKHLSQCSVIFTV
jgi:hypothetical protein